MTYTSLLEKINQSIEILLEATTAYEEE